MAEKSTAKRPKVGGREKGTPNRVTASAKENILAVFTRLGGTAEMAAWARRHPTDFYKLYARLIPTEQRIGNADGESLKVEATVRFVDAARAD